MGSQVALKTTRKVRGKVEGGKGVKERLHGAAHSVESFFEVKQDSANSDFLASRDESHKVG